MRDSIAKFVVYLAVVFIALTLTIAPAFASVLQVITPDIAPDWDESSSTQSGLVGLTPVTITTTRTPWNTTFTNEWPGYSSVNYFGSLAQPAGTTGDFLNHHVSNGDIFTTKLKLGGSLLNPTIYVSDIDTVGAWVTYPSGGTSSWVNADGSFSGNTMTALSGAQQDTSGAFSAIQYTGLFPTDTEFLLSFNFDIDSVVVSENVAIGLAAVDVDQEEPSTAVPEPATMALFGIGAVGAFLRKKKS